MGGTFRFVGICTAFALMIATGGVAAQSPMPSSLAPGGLTIPMPSGQPDLTIPDPATLTQDDAAKAYAELIHDMRQQAGLIDALGPNGEDIYAFIDASQADFMRRYHDELVQQLGQVGDVASIAGPMPPVARMSDEIGGGTYAFFGAWMVAGFAQLDRSRRESGQLPTKTETITNDKNGYRTSIELTTDWAYSFDGNQLATTSTVAYATTVTDLATGKTFAQPSGSDSVTIELTGCPDSSGLVVARVKNAHVEGSTAAGSSGSATFKSEMNVHIFVDDSATAVRQETATTSDIAMRRAYRASGVMSDDWDSSTGFTRSESRSGTSKSGSPEWAPDTSRPGQSSGSGDFRSVADPDAAVDLVRGALFVAAILPAVMSSPTIDSAEKYWRGGNCVEVAVLQGNGGDVEAGSETQVVAQPRHKIEKVDLAKPVVATFSGVAGAQPVGVAIPAPAEFVYTAGERTGTPAR